MIRILMSFCILVISCASASDSEKNIIEDNRTIESTVSSIPSVIEENYDTKNPSQINKLPKNLKEVSGLSLGKEGVLLAINDEDGDLFQINKNTGKLISKSKFWKDGDFEGVEQSGDDTYVVKSNGELYRYNENDRPKTKKYDLGLNKKNNIEGLALDHDKKHLILALKGDPDKKGKNKKSRAIYTLDLNKKGKGIELLWRLKFKTIEKWIKKNYTKGDNRDRLIKRAIKIAPSGIASHPFLNNTYVLSSSGKTLFVLDKNGKIEMIHFFPEKEFKQPEGICFDTNGDLLIADEGEKGRARLFRFKYLKGE